MDCNPGRSVLCGHGLWGEEPVRSCQVPLDATSSNMRMYEHVGGRPCSMRLPRSYNSGISLHIHTQKECCFVSSVQIQVVL